MDCFKYPNEDVDEMHQVAVEQYRKKKEFQDLVAKALVTADGLEKDLQKERDALQASNMELQAIIELRVYDADMHNKEIEDVLPGGFTSGVLCICEAMWGDRSRSLFICVCVKSIPFQRLRCIPTVHPVGHSWPSMAIP